jgi:hypothetical protein
MLCAFIDLEAGVPLELEASYEETCGVLRVPLG